jgi:hypothetical protein
MTRADPKNGLHPGFARTKQFAIEATPNTGRAMISRTRESLEAPSAIAMAVPGDSSRCSRAVPDDPGAPLLHFREQSLRIPESEDEERVIHR